jgi:sugar lactone lactonase YvrE
VRRLAWLIAVLVVLLGVVRPVTAQVTVELVVGLPVGVAAYGLAVGPDGALYVGDIGGRRGEIFVFTQSGRLRERIQVPAGPTGLVALRGLAFDGHGNLYVADLADGDAERGRVLKITPRGRLSVFASGLTAPTAIALDREGIVYVTDALNGAVHWFGPDGATAQFVEDERLRSDDGDGLGASGLAFAPDGSALYISSFSEDRILRVAIDKDGSAGRLSVLADGGDLRGGRLDGPLGLAVDGQGNLLVAAHRSDEILILSPRGRLLARVPAEGGSLFSNPTALATAGQRVYVANLGLESGLSHISRFELAGLDE